MGCLSLPYLEDGVSYFIYGFGGESTDAEEVVWADWVHGGDMEGDGFGGPDLSEDEGLSLCICKVVD